MASRFTQLAVVLAVASGPMGLVSADEFPVITWYQANRSPFSGAGGYSAPSCADTHGSDGDVDCKKQRCEKSLPSLSTV
jgi:hypothetical protein